MKKPIPFGKYYLLNRVSVGGMAEVFKAKTFGVEDFERILAVKRILPSIAEDEEFITMFIDEAKIAVQLQHANIAQIFDLGKVGDSYFIAMEYVSGKDVRTIFEMLSKNGQTFGIPMAIYLAMKICEGLDYAHNKRDAAGRDLNLVHRDVSPQNILVSYDGEVKLIDFGIAKAAGKAGKTQAGILKGKFGYMSPEQVRGLPLDRRSDIFAMGICLWEMVTGERLFVGESDFSTLEKVRNVEIIPPSSYNKNVPDDLEVIVLKSLSKEVEDRYQTAMDMHDDLQKWMYSTGNFFARRDLAAFMYGVFSREIEKEAATSDTSGGFIQKSTTPPPPPQRRLAATSVPPPPPSKARKGLPRPPSPTRRPAGATLPPPPPPGSLKTGSGAAAPPPPQKMRVPAPPGVITTSPGVSPTRPPGIPGGPGKLPPDLAKGSVAAPYKNAQVAMDDWDDDEPPTNLYSKEDAAEMAKAAISPPRTSQPFDDLEKEEDLSEIDVESEFEKPSRKKIALYAGIAASAIIVISAIIFMMMGKGGPGTLNLQVEPSDDLQLVIDGSKLLPGNMSPFSISDITPGNHVITIKREGYKSQQVSVEIEPGKTIARSISLLRRATGFKLVTEPVGASVWVDDRPLEEKTPVSVTDLTPGSHLVRIAKGEAFAPKTIEVNVVAGKVIKLPKKILELKVVDLTFNSIPEGARVILISGNDQKNIGNTPVSFSLDTSKNYKVKYSKREYEDFTMTLAYKAGKEKLSLEPVKLSAVRKEPSSSTPSSNIRVAKRPVRVVSKSTGGPGKISISSKPWSKVYINGKFIKNTPLINYTVRAGTHNITLENPAFNIKKSYRVKVKPGQTTTFVKKLL